MAATHVEMKKPCSLKQAGINESFLKLNYRVSGAHIMPPVNSSGLVSSRLGDLHLYEGPEERITSERDGNMH
jgi:hypothetical protein